MTSLAGARCPACGAGLPAGGRALSAVEDGRGLVAVRYGVRCGSCGRAYLLESLSRPCGWRLLSRSGAVVAASDADGTGDTNNL